MTAPSEPESSSATGEDDQEITLRLSDILPRVPPHLLKPGPHDTTARVRFSIEELSEKISRGRVSVPLERLASAYPDVFRESTAFLAQEEISLPLQKLLEQVGLAIPKSSSANGIPEDQLAQARAQASRILEASGAPAPPEIPAPQPQTLPSAQSFRIAKAIAAARQILGVFARPADPSASGPAVEKPPEANPSVTELKPAPAARDTEPAPAAGQEAVAQAGPEAGQPLAGETAPAPAEDGPREPATLDRPQEQAAQERPKEQAAPDRPKEQATSDRPQEHSTQSVPEGCISLRLLPIFRLLPAQVLRGGALPPDDARVALPLSAIDPQLAGGHVEIPLEDFIKALPTGISQALAPVPETQVWIPLDEIFQNLPAHHLFYMPPLDAPAEAKSAPTEEPPSAAPLPDQNDEPPAAAKVAEPPPKQPIPAPSAPASSTPSAKAAPPETDTAPQRTLALPAPPAQSVTPPPHSQEPPCAESTPALPAASPTAPHSPEPPCAESTPPPPAADLTPPPSPEPTSTESTPAPPAASPAPPPSQEPPSAESASPPPTAPSAEQQPPPPSRAPWTRGFQVPPPRLFSAGAPLAEPASHVAPVEPAPPAATPEAKHTADFLAGQPGIFASAAFVQGAVFASADFPRKPDLDALRDFMAAFIDSARESGRRLGWNRALTIPCEQFHLTAVVRDTHFIVALHHDRVLASATHEALIAAADALSEAAG